MYGTYIHSYPIYVAAETTDKRGRNSQSAEHADVDARLTVSSMQRMRRGTGARVYVYAHTYTTSVALPAREKGTYVNEVGLEPLLQVLQEGIFALVVLQ